MIRFSIMSCVLMQVVLGNTINKLIGVFAAGIPVILLGGLAYRLTSGKTLWDGIVSIYGALYKIPGMRLSVPLLISRHSSELKDTLHPAQLCLAATHLLILWHQALARLQDSRAKVQLLLKSDVIMSRCCILLRSQLHRQSFYCCQCTATAFNLHSHCNGGAEQMLPILPVMSLSSTTEAGIHNVRLVKPAAVACLECVSCMS